MPPESAALRRARVPPYAGVSLAACFVLLVWLCLPNRGVMARHAVSDVAFVLAPAAATWRCWTAARRGGPWAATWQLLAAAVASWTLGSVVWAVQELALGKLSPFPSPADVGWLLFPVLAVAGLLVVPGMPRGRASGTRLLLDAVATGAALLLLAWVGPLGAAVASGSAGLTHVVEVAFPALDVLAVAGVIVVLDRLRGRLDHPVVLAATGIVVAALSDSTYSLLSTHSGYSAGGPLDVVWAGSFLLIGYAAGRPEGARAETRSGRRQLLPTVPAVAAIALLLGTGGLSRGLEPALVVVVVVLGAALAARQHLLSVENRELHASLEQRVAERTEELREAREVFRHRAYTDTLTGLANRDAFHAALTGATAGQDGQYVGVVLLDLDGFKQVNDGFGHDTGDQVLIAVADRLRRCLRRTDAPDQDIARLGGDEFACLLPDLSHPRDADAVATRLIDALRASVVVDGREFFLGASAGVAVAETPLSVPAGELLREADTAMYAAKDAGGSRHRTFDARMHSRVVAQVALEADLHRALAEGEIRVDYQPIFSLQHRRITGVEALARWTSPTRGEVSPAEFIAVAERTGLIVQLERQVLDQVCRQLAQWRRVIPDLKVGVNFSARHLREPDLLSAVLATVGRHGVPASAIVAEVTESLFFSDEDVVSEVLQALDAAGMVLALDDFGTGYSSLSRLSRHPFRILKVDRTFLSEVRADGAPPAILMATLAMARGLGLDVVAEGVETQEQLDFLVANGCGFAQGYLLARPASPRRLDALLLEQLIPSQAY